MSIRVVQALTRRMVPVVNNGSESDAPTIARHRLYRSSKPQEPPLQFLTEPCVNLSIHTALTLGKNLAPFVKEDLLRARVMVWYSG